MPGDFTNAGQAFGVTTHGNNTVAMSNNWLDTNAGGNWIDWTWYPSTYPVTIHTHYCSCWCHDCRSSKIRLTLKEVDTLRRASKKDTRLREVLQKLTPKIEVEVDFE